MVCGFFLPVLLALVSCGRPTGPGAPGPPKTWVTLKGCRFEPNDFNDGDSFHVRHNGQEFVFRLYFVDAPETDESVVERNREQCRYFGVTPKQLRDAGLEAKNLAADLLRKPFTVETRSQDAMGRSQRYYADVTVGGEDLGGILVSRGLARAKGTPANRPGAATAKERKLRLEQIEAKARSEHRGIWAHSTKAKKQSWWRRWFDW